MALSSCVGASAYDHAVTTLHASISLKPPSHDAAGHDPQTRELTESGDTYDNAMNAVRAAVPEGYELNWVRRTA